MAPANGESPAEPRLAIGNPHRSTLPGPDFLDHLISFSADDGVAIEYLDHEHKVSTITYRLLDELSSKLARRIQGHLENSPARNQIIPVILPQHPALYVSYQAVLRSGAAFCPITPDTPEDRLSFIIKDVGATLVLCSPENAQSLQRTLPSATCLPVELESLSHHDLVSPVSGGKDRRSSDVAYVIYTSGSTGKPKGVPVSHRAVTQSLLAHDEHIPPFKRFLQFAAPTFDVSLFEIFFPWYRGSTLVCCERERLLANLPGTINHMGVDAVELTPTVATTLLRKRSAVPKLRILLTIGEMLTPQVVQEFGRTEHEESMLFAMYGPTEAAIHCTIVPMMSASGSVRDIGRPLSTVTTLVLEEETSSHTPEILALERTGELAIAGQLAEGYLNRQEQMDAVFIELPGHGIVYRTGDRAMMTLDGNLQILGRISGGQVKLRGQRVELGEIEETASQAPGVDLAVAIVIRDTLVLFCSGDAALQTINVERRCKAWLPRHMRPGDIVVLPEGLPRLPSGKVDRKRLEAQYRERQSEIDIPSPSNGPEAGLEMAAMISDELHTTMDLHSSLWAHGLDSLRAIRLASKLRSKYPNVSVSTILGADSVADLINILDVKKPFDESKANLGDFRPLSSGWKTLVETVTKRTRGQIHPLKIDEVLPCAPIQSAMLSETLQDPKQNMNKIVLQVDPLISLARLIKAFEDVANDNAILRAGFVATPDPDMPFVQVIKHAPAFDKACSLLFPLHLTTNEMRHTVEVHIHHALYDGWSWDIILRDINALLKGGKLHRRPSFHDLTCAKQAQASLDDESNLMAWTSRLQHAEPCGFPVLQSRSFADASTMQHVSALSVDAETLSRIAQKLHVSRPSILHAALSLLLANLVGTTDVISGLVVAGRDAVLPGAEDVIGPCLSTLPLRVQLGRCSTSRELMLHVYQEHMHCLRHSNISFARIRSALGAARDMRLFDAIFVWQESVHSQTDTNDLVSTKESHDNLEYALVVEIEPTGASFRLKTTFQQSKISTGQIQMIHDQLNYLTSALINFPDHPLANVWRESPRSLLSISNIEPSQPRETDLTATIARTAHTKPDRIAIDLVTDFDCETRSIQRQTLSYQQLYNRAQNTAWRLIEEQRLVANDIVLICCSKSLDFYTLICATVMAGAAYLCVDPSTPEDHLWRVIKQADPALLVFDEQNSMKHACTSHKSTTTLGNIVEQASRTDGRLPTRILGSDLAYAVFTSGSTGVPKGVLITRENLMSNIEHLAKFYPHHTEARLLQSCSPAFDVSVFEIFWTWHCGMTLCSADNDVLFRDIEKLIDTLNVTHLSMTPSVAALVDPRRVSKVQFLVCAGEPMSAKVFEAWVDHGLHQGYGPSETTNICNVRSYANSQAPIGNVGPALPNTSLFICSRASNGQHASPLDTSSFNLLPQGAVGEIWIGGAQVGRGYTDPNLTARSWLEHPQYGRLYRSGDIGRLLTDGSLVVLGREDEQAKIRGQRIELNEVNSTLMRSNLVSDAFTFILSDVSSRDKLVSFWARRTQLGQGEGNDVGVLFEHLRDTLPAYMIPECLIPVQAVPLTRQGKVNKRELASVHDRLTKGELAKFSGPLPSDYDNDGLTEGEAQVVKVVSEISGVPLSDINVHASFFTYGIDSIRAISLTQRLRQLGYDGIKISDIMRYSSVRRLLARTRSSITRDHEQPSGITSVAASKFVPARLEKDLRMSYGNTALKIQTIFPCTPLQEVMLSSASTSSSSYVNHLTYRLVTDVERIKEAWTKIVDRHELLRTVFAMTEEPEMPYVQIVLEHFDLPWKQVAHPASDEVISPFDRPPYSLQTTRISDRNIELHLFMHHALYDAEALNNLHKEIEAICVAEQLLPAVPFSKYLAFMVHASSEGSETFWQHNLKNVEPCRLSNYVKQRPFRTTSMLTSSGTRRFSYSTLSLCTRATSTTVLALLQASLARLLYAYFRTSDVCFGTVFSGRNVDIPGIDSVIGPCFNTLPTRLRAMHSTTVADLCQKLQQFNVEVLPFQATALRRLQKRHSPDGRPLFDVLLLLQSSTTSLNHKLWQLISEEGQMDFPFIFEVVLDAQNDEVHFNLHTTQADGTTFVEKLLSDFLIVLEDTMEHPQALALRLTEVSAPAPQVKPNGHIIPNSKSHVSTQATKGSMMRTAVAGVVLDALAKLSSRGTSMINPQTNIFQLGLDSMNAVQLASRLRSKGYQVTVGDILEEPRIEAIIDFCDRHQLEHVVMLSDKHFDLAAFDKKHRQRTIEFLRLHEDDVEAVYPCTATQSGILSEFLRSDGRLYYNSMRLRLRSDLDHGLLHEMWPKIVERHPILRSGFVEVDDSQHPFAMVIYNYQSKDRSWLSLERGSRCLSPKSLKDVSNPPWRICIEQVVDTSFMELHILHALYDALSLQHILSDLEALYHHEYLPAPPPIAKALSSILSLNQSHHLNNKFWQYVKDNVQPTRFPDLNISREIPSKLHIASRAIAHPPSTLQERCEKRACSLLTACQVAWAKLLAAYTGQQVVVFGNILSGRSFNDEELNDVAFPCINTLPVLVDVSTHLDQMLGEVQKYTSELQKNPHVPLSKVKNMLEAETDLFDTVLVLQRFSPKFKSRGLWEMVSDEATAEYAVSLEIIPDSDSVTLQLTYNQKVLPVEHSDVLLKQYEQVLYEVLDLKHDSTPNDLLHARLAPKSPMIETAHACLHDLVFASAFRNLDKIALEFVTSIEDDGVTKQTQTYRGLVSKAAQVAHLLVQEGAQPGDFVAVCFEKCPEASSAILGVLMAGCAYVAIDPGAPTARKQFVLEDSKCKVVLTTSTTAKSLGEVAAKVICMDATGILQQHSSEPPKLSRAVTGDDICYCLYTSGTTGTPKGCLISHRSIVQAMLCFSRIFDGHWAAESRWLQFAGYHFDVSVLEHFWTWKEGLCVTVAPRDLLFEDLPGTINKLGITHLDLTPSLARLLTPQSVPSLCQGVFIIGGEQVRQEIIDMWGEAGCLYNFYGPSEVTPGCTVHPRVKKLVKPTNIGQQWDNVGSYVLESETEKPVMIGAIGELCLSGVLVGEGYLNRPELTAEKFVTLESTGERIYRTGDLVRMLHDHSFEYLSRIDDQVKLRGQRLEIGEINHVLSQCSPDFSDVATVVAKHLEQEKEQLVAFLAQSRETKLRNGKPVLVHNEAVSARLHEVRRQASDMLPAYMVPTYFIAVDFLPLTVNNKVDAKSLKCLYESTSLQKVRHQQESAASVSSIPEGQMERLIELVANYIESDQTEIGTRASLLQLGIDSISVIGLSRALKAAGYANASVALIMKRPVLMDLAEALFEDQKLDGHAAVEEACDRIKSFAVKHNVLVGKILKVSQQEVRHIAPCTALQEGMISKMVSSNNKQLPYLNRFVYRLDESVDFDQLSKAWAVLQAQLDILRTRFVPTEDGYAQVVLEQHSNTVNVDYGADFIKDDPLEAIEGCFNRWTTKMQQLESQPPWEVWLTQRERGRVKYMSLFIFHGIYDGISIPLLLNALYRSYDRPAPSVLHAPQFFEALPYGPLLGKPNAPEFWRCHLRRVRLLNLENQEVAAAADVGTAHCVLRLAGIRRQCSTIAVTPQAIFHAAWVLTLAKHFEINPTIGIVLSGRSIELENAERVIGPMFNTVPFTIDDLPKNATAVDLIKKCHQRNVDALPYQHTALSNIKRWIKLDSKQELFDSLFVYQGLTNTHEQTSQWPWMEQQSSNVVDYPLNVEIDETARNEYSINIVTANSLGKDVAENLMQSMQETLESMRDNDKLLLPSVFLDDSIGDILEYTAPKPDQKVNDGDFRWTKQAKIIKTELAVLAEVNEADISHSHPTIFELGLDSIDILKLAARLKNKDIRLPVSKIMQSPTVAGLTEIWSALNGVDLTADSGGYIEMDKDWKSILADQGMNVGQIEIVFPATPIQEGLLVDFAKYFHTLVYELHSDTNVSSFIDAIHQSIQDLPVLRTRFVMLDDPVNGITFLQAVRRAPTGRRKPQISYKIDSINELRVQSPTLDDSTPSLQIAVTKDNKVYFVLALSHAHYDAWSLQFLLDHIIQCYHAQAPAAVSIEPIAKYEFDMRQAATTSSIETFWLRELDTIASTLITPLQIENAFPPGSSSNGSSRSKMLGPNLLRVTSGVDLDLLQQTCRKNGVTMQSFGLTAWALTLMHITGQLNINFGLVVSGRISEETERLVFPTFNTVVFRPRIDLKSDKQKLLKQVHDLAVEIFEHQHFPLSHALRLAKSVGPELFNTLFTFQRTPRSGIDNSSLLTEVNLGDEHISPPYAVNVEMEEKEGDLCLTIATQEGIMNHEQADRVLSTLDHVLEFLVLHDRSPIFAMVGEKTVSICNMPQVTLIEEQHPENRALVKKEDNAANEDEFWSDHEHKIRTAFSKASGVDEGEISKRTSLFHLGLDSVNAIKVSKLLRDAAMKVPVSIILRHQSIEKIAAAIHESTTQDTKPPQVSTEQSATGSGLMKQLERPLLDASVAIDSIEDVMPATAGQIYMLDLWRASQGRLSQASFWLAIEHCSRSTFQEAFRDLVNKVPALRTRFLSHGGSTFQIVFKPATQDPGPWHYDFEEHDEKLLVALHLHHALYDAVSLDVILRELQGLCQGVALRAPVNTDIRPFIELTYNNKALAGRFWTDYLGRDAISSAQDAHGSFEAERTELFIPHLTAAHPLEQLARRHGLSVQAIFFAIIAQIHAQTRPASHQQPTRRPPSATVGIYLANRSLDLDGITDLAAPTFNVVPLKVDISGSGAEAILRSARMVQHDLEEIGRPEHCGVSLRDIHAWTGVTLDCVVNFLKLPGAANADAEQEDAGTSGAKAVVRHAEGEARDRARQIVEAKGKAQQARSPFIDGAVEDLQGAGWCVPAFDVEARVDAAGRLAVGMFAPGDMLDAEDVRGLMDTVKTMLEGLTSENEE